MNHEIRKFLIDQSIKGKPVSYEIIGKKLQLNLENPDHRNQMGQELIDISTYEWENDRPLLSSMVIYKNGSGSGKGFYKLCEELGMGKASKLKDELYAFQEMNKCKAFWSDTTNYEEFYHIEDQTKGHQQDFFTVEELNFFSVWVNKVYDKSKQDHVAAANYIKNSLGTKTQYWSKKIVEQSEGLVTFNRRMWGQKGWAEGENGKIRVSKFKPYTWARIYRKEDHRKDIFFTVGVDGEKKELVYKLDYYFEGESKLTKEQKEVVRKNIKKEERREIITFDKLKEYNWDELLKESTSFINEYLHEYDELIQLAWGEVTPQQILTNRLSHKPFPKNGIQVLPELNPNFEGIEKDYIQEAIEKKELGDAGEQLVLQHEIKRLKSSTSPELANRVKIEEKDGKGYDILSFFTDRTPKYIEVKTTTGNDRVPFQYTINEKLFAEKNGENYSIYRLYNFNAENNTADFYEIKNVGDSLLMQPTVFKCYVIGEEYNKIL